MITFERIGKISEFGGMNQNFGTPINTLIHEFYREVQPYHPPAVRIAYRTGTLQKETEIEKQHGRSDLTEAALARTARSLMDGNTNVH